MELIGEEQEKEATRFSLAWVEQVNEPQTEGELEALRRSVQRGSPFGSVLWQQNMAARLGLEHTLRPLGRPKKETAAESDWKRAAS